ncbi:MAG: fibronectin type III domain-containing protein [Candidatus Acidiferrales bacterium]
MAPHSQGSASARTRRIHPAGHFAFGAALLLLFGCAAPGVPVTRQPAVPRAITDLSAKQSGDSIVLTFTLPKETIQGKALSKPPAIEIYRAFGSVQAVSGGGTSEQPQLVTTVPSQMVEQYREGGRIRFSDVLAPTDFAAHVGSAALYAVRTRLGKHDSGDSNLVRVQILPAPQPIADLRAQITQTIVELRWTVPAILPTRSAPPASFRYRIYRAEVPAGNRSPAVANSNTQSESAQSVLLGESATPSYGDTSFTFGHTYAYSVRSVAAYKSGSVESEESNVLDVTPRDTFAPATPENIAATATPSNGSAAPHVDLSWAIHSESDLLGYNVYRSDTESSPGTRVNAAPLVTPVFRDDSVVPGAQYFYCVTAVDRAGNESALSAPVAVTVPTADSNKNL